MYCTNLTSDVIIYKFNPENVIPYELEIILEVMRLIIVFALH